MLRAILLINVAACASFQLGSQLMLHQSMLTRPRARFGPEPVACASSVDEAYDSASSLESVDDTTFEAAVVHESSQRPVIVEFCADWCAPCKLVEPLLVKLASRGDAKVLKAKPEETEAARFWLDECGHKVAAVPFCVLFENGRPTASFAGNFRSMERLQAFMSGALKEVHQGLRVAHSPFERWSQSQSELTASLIDNFVSSATKRGVIIPARVRSAESLPFERWS